MTAFEIDRLGLLGDGIAQDGAGGTLYAPRALPGEVVSGILNGDRLEDMRVVTPSNARVKAPCAHYSACGGCALQHARDDFVASWKQDVVRKALEARGIEADVLPPVTSPPNARRRAALAGRRTKKGALVGFHGRASGQITPVPGCQILAPDILSCLSQLEEITRLGASRSAEVRLHVMASETGVDLLVEGAKPLDGPMRAALARFAETFARITWDGDVILQRAPPVVTFGTAQVTPPPGAFLQATKDGENALVTPVLAALGPARSIVDLFAGCGTFTFPAAQNAPVHAVEGDSDLIAALDRGVRHTQGLKPITTEVRDLFRNPLLPEDLARFDAAIIDPPRAGAEAQMHALAEARLPVIAAVSCNPVTFARDMETLTKAGYHLGPIQVVDQFRWSPHIEVVTALHLEKP